MNELEKSDPFTVAEKPVNNSGRSVVESAERREGKGPRGTCASRTRTGHGAGLVCHRGLSVYESEQSKGRRNGFTALLLEPARCRTQRGARPGARYLSRCCRWRSLATPSPDSFCRWLTIRCC